MTQETSHIRNFRIFAPFAWLLLVGTAFTGSSFFLLSSLGKAPAGAVLGLYVARSPQNTETSFKTTATDARTAKVEKVFKKFNCPLAGQGDFIVQKADEYNIPYWLVPAVSFQESSCGKNPPTSGGIEDSYNAWGYGVWGKNAKAFDSWEAGITAVSKYFGTNFFSKGITDVCEIMEIYTPPSNGSWCEGVKYFGEMIEGFETD